jgi:2-oxoglutarate dehydrogenase E1 component
MARSNLEDMTGESIFQRYLPDVHPENLQAPEKIKRHILCTGQVYYQLLKEREDKGITDVAISRVEQLSPLPYDLVSSLFSLSNCLRTDVLFVSVGSNA